MSHRARQPYGARGLEDVELSVLPQYATAPLSSVLDDIHEGDFEAAGDDGVMSDAEGAGVVGDEGVSSSTPTTEGRHRIRSGTLPTTLDEADAAGVYSTGQKRGSRNFARPSSAGLAGPAPRSRSGSATSQGAARGSVRMLADIGPRGPERRRRKALNVARPRSGTMTAFPRFTNLDHLRDMDEDDDIDRLRMRRNHDSDNPFTMGIDPSLLINKSRSSTMISDVRPDIFSSWIQPSSQPHDVKTNSTQSLNSMNQVLKSEKSPTVWDNIFETFFEGWEMHPVDDIDSDTDISTVPKFYCLRPGSAFSRTWKVVMFIVNLFVISSTPFEIAFLSELPTSILAIEITTEMVMISDIIVQFHRGFSARQSIIMYPRHRIWENYLKSRFALDFITSIPFVIISAGTRKEIAVIILAFRFVRVLRTYRIHLVLEKWEVRTLQPYRIRLLMLCASVVYCTHIVGCMRYGFGRMTSEGPNEWLKVPDFHADDIWDDYSISIYWAYLVMMQPGPPDQPSTKGEIFFTIFTMTVGVAITATAIGTLGTLFMQLDMTRSHHQQLTEEVNQYLKYRNVPKRLKREVQNYFNYIWERHRGVNEANFLQLLPRYLRLRLSLHINAEIIRKVSFFKNIPPRVMELLLDRMTPLTCVPQEIIVYEGDKGEEMFFINSGEVEVYKNADMSTTRTMAEGQCFGEMAILTGGLRAANVRAKTYCELFVLKKVDFDKVIADYPNLKEGIVDISQRRNSLAGGRPGTGQFTPTPLSQTTALGQSTQKLDEPPVAVVSNDD